MNGRRLTGLGLVLALAVATAPAGAVSAGGCPIELPQGGEPVTLDAADFVAGIDHPFWPMIPGSRWVSREVGSDGVVQRVTVTVTDRTREILGIAATVVHDVVRADGELVENTFDWYAQDVCGNVWYLGENTAEYEDGEVVSTEGSWEAGVDGAQGGVLLPADPAVGMTYRQEHLAGEAEDAAAVLSLGEQADVPFGHVDDVLLTKEFTPLHPRVLELKFYARGVGPVLAIGISGGSDREELVRFVVPSP